MSAPQSPAPQSLAPVSPAPKSMREFLAEARRVAEAKRGELSEKSAEDDSRRREIDAEKNAKLQEVIDSLVAIILESVQYKIDSAAKRSFTKTNIFVYHPDTRFDGKEVVTTQDKKAYPYSLAFLVSGPRDKGGEKYWESIGVKSVMSQLKEKLAPAFPRHWFPGKRAGNVIELDWSKVE